jgi:CRISPR-associated endoribonuclease Cas6
MRIYLKLTKNTEPVPYNYQPFLTGALHKWLGSNNIEHGKISLYSFSWLQNIDTIKDGINTKYGSYFFISAYNDSIIKSIIGGIREDSELCFGICVTEIHIQENPIFSSPQRFDFASPIFVRRLIDNKDCHISYDDNLSSEYLTETIKRKLSIAGLPDEGVKIRFDESYEHPKTKLVKYQDIGNKTNLCPIIVEGTPEQLSFIWNVGAGNSTGIGFGALR